MFNNLYGVSSCVWEQMDTGRHVYILGYTRAGILGQGIVVTRSKYRILKMEKQKQTNKRGVKKKSYSAGTRLRFHVGSTLNLNHPQG